MTKFTKSDLKTGHIVETRCGERYLILKDCAVPDCMWLAAMTGDIMINCTAGQDTTGWMSLDSYTNDLLCSSYDVNEAENDALPWVTDEVNRGLDIVAIYQAGVPSNWHGVDDPQHTFGKPMLIWKRTEEVTKPSKSCETCCHNCVCGTFDDIDKYEYPNEEMYYEKITEMAENCEYYSEFCE